MQLRETERKDEKKTYAAEKKSFPSALNERQNILLIIQEWKKIQNQEQKANKFCKNWSECGMSREKKTEKQWKIEREIEKGGERVPNDRKREKTTWIVFRAQTVQGLYKKCVQYIQHTTLCKNTRRTLITSSKSEANNGNQKIKEKQNTNTKLTSNNNRSATQQHQKLSLSHQKLAASKHTTHNTPRKWKTLELPRKPWTHTLTLTHSHTHTHCTQAPDTIRWRWSAKATWRKCSASKF